MAGNQGQGNALATPPPTLPNSRREKIRLSFGENRRIVNTIMVKFTPLSDVTVPVGLDLPEGEQVFCRTFTISFRQEYWNPEQEMLLRAAGNPMGWGVSILKSLGLEPRSDEPASNPASNNESTNAIPVRMTIRCEAISFYITVVHYLESDSSMNRFMDIIFEE